MSLREKIKKLSPELQAKFVLGERVYNPQSTTPVSNYLVETKRHCNAGRTVDAGLWLRDHCAGGGKIFLTMSGAGSSFQQGIMISELIRKGKIAALSVSPANLEESLYRLLSPDDYAYIPDYQELTRDQEKELDRAEFRRITDTMLPEEETVRQVLDQFEKLWREAQKKKQSFLWHEYFLQLFKKNLIKFDKNSRHAQNCWLYQAYLHGIPIFICGAEDSTMGNIFTYFSYNGNDPFLKKYKQKKPISLNVVKSSFSYMHHLAEWYMNNTKEKGLAFLQLGGGAAGDFPICVVPHLKKDFLFGLSIKNQEKLIRSWAGFIEIHLTPMSGGSYGGAGFKEKITWSKFEVDAFGIQIYGDYTTIFPDISALVLRR